MNAVQDYTNGFSISAVQAALVGRLAWRTGTSATPDSGNSTSKSGRYFDDFHAACTADNLFAVQPNGAANQTQFNTYLTSLQKSVIMRSLNAVFSAPEYIEQVLLFERFGRQDQLIANAGNFCGYHINIAKAFDKVVQINSATLLFDTDCSFTLYLFKDGKKTPIWSQSVSVAANEMTVVDFPDCILSYISGATKGSQFYFGYFQDDLGTAKAYRENVIEWNKTLVFGAYPFVSKKTGATDFDHNVIGYTGQNFGLNLEISSFKDWTQIIVKRPNLFDELIGLSMAFVVLEQIIYSLRSSGTERLLKDGISNAALIQDLNGVAPVTDGPPPITGLNKRIEREAKRVRDSVLKDNQPQSVNIGSTCSMYEKGPAQQQAQWLNTLQHGYN